MMRVCVWVEKREVNDKGVKKTKKEEKVEE